MSITITPEQRARLGAAILTANEVLEVVVQLQRTSESPMFEVGKALLYASAVQFREDLERLLKDGKEA